VIDILLRIDWLTGLWLSLLAIGLVVSYLGIREADKDEDAAKLLGVNGAKIFVAKRRRNRERLRSGEHFFQIALALWLITHQQGCAFTAFRDQVVSVFILLTLFVIYNSLADLSETKTVQALTSKETF
jgi:hypothetical protein